MSDQPATQTNGPVGTVVNLAGSVVKGLSSEFLALCAVNSVFILGLLWFLHAENTLRAELVNKLLTTCIDRQH